MLTCCILTRDSAAQLPESIASVRFADRVIVIDDGSTDATRTIAASLGATVIKRALDGDFAAQRNAVLDACPDGWVLFLDSDERVTAELAAEIGQRVGRETGPSAYSVPRQDTFEGRILRYGETAHVRLVRIARKEAGRWVRPVHEYWRVDGPVAMLRHPITHEPHSSVAAFLTDINRYTDLDAAEFYRSGSRVSWWQPVVYPAAKFFVNYILRGGYRDGMPGMIHAMTMSFHSFLTRGKIWQLQRRDR